jgi:hypothetical protein
MWLLLFLFAIAWAQPKEVSQEQWQASIKPYTGSVTYQESKPLFRHDTIEEIIKGENNIAVSDLSARGIDPEDARIASERVQSELQDIGRYKVIERGGLEELLSEQGLQLSGSVQQVVRVGRVLGISKVVTGSVGKTDDAEWFYSLRLLDVETGEVLGSDYSDVSGNFGDFLSAARISVHRLLGLTKKELKRDPMAPVREVTIRNEVVGHEVHVFHHKAEGSGQRVFIPCSFCQGRGKLQDGKDCPYCTSAIKYNGAETHYQAMTGRWSN